MKKVNRLFFIMASMVIAFFIMSSDKIEALDDFVVINANSNGEATNVHLVADTSSNTDSDGDGILDIITELKQFTVTRDITLTVNAPETILSTYKDFIVCEVLSVDGNGKESTDVDNCPKYSLNVTNKVYNYQLKSPNDGRKIIYIIFDHEGKRQWDENDDLIRKEVTLDTTGPVINLNGGEYVYVPLGKKYSELGATCEDDSNVLSDGGCTVDIEETRINMNKSGFQYIRYTAVDFLGNEVNVLRKVMVEVKKDDDDSNLSWYISGLALFVLTGFVTIRVIKNKEKQKNQSVL